MTNSKERETSLRRLELQIGYFLRGGAWFSGLLMTVGWVWSLWAKGSAIKTFSDDRFESLREMLQRAIVTQDFPQLICLMGLLILVCLPVFRVFLTVFLFLHEKDYPMAMMALLVFIVIVFSFSLGLTI